MRAFFHRFSRTPAFAPQPLPSAACEVEASNAFLIAESLPLQPSEEPDDPALSLILRRWRGWYDAAGGVPHWSAFKPSENTAILPRLVLYDAQPDARFFISLVGEDVRHKMPIAMHKQYLDDVMPAANLSDIRHRLTSALEQKQPNHVCKSMGWKQGHEYQIYRALHLPFIHKGPNPERVLSVMSFNETVRTPLNELDIRKNLR